MFRIWTLLIAMTLFHTTLCGAVFADPDHSIVRVGIEKNVADVSVSGRTRLDVVTAVLCGLEKCQLPTEGVTVGPWLHLPEKALKELDKRPFLTVCIGDQWDGGATTAYIATTPKVPFNIVLAIATELRTCGFTDIRLISDDTVRSDILMLTAPQVPSATAEVEAPGKMSE